MSSLSGCVQVAAKVRQESLSNVPDYFVQLICPQVSHTLLFESPAETNIRNLFEDMPTSGSSHSTKLSMYRRLIRIEEGRAGNIDAVYVMSFGIARI